MAKAVEITFAIGAALTGGFSGAFGKAGQALGELQKQATSLQKVSGQIESYQKLQGAIAENEAAMASMRQQAQSLDTQIAASKVNTSELSAQHRTAQQEVDRLNSVYVRNNDAYKAATLNMKSLENQILSSKQPTGELQAQYVKAQEEVRKLGGALKQSGDELKAARTKAEKLKTEMQASAAKTRDLSAEARHLTTDADHLEGKLDRDREALSKLRTELEGAGVDTNNLAASQAKLAAQSQRLADAQTRLQNSRAALQETRQKLSLSNMKGDLIKSAGIGYSLYKPTMIAADFEQAMARTKAVAFTGKNKTPEQKAADDAAFKELQDQALQLGADTQFTAIQAAQSQEMLARAGFKSKEIISAMPGLLSMAAAEGMDLATAADIAASTLRGFNLEADQSGRVADVLAQMSAASNSSIVGLGESMKYVAPVASGLGMSVEETAAMLGVMANAGIKGSQAGTALRSAFTRLSKEPRAVEKALKRLGIATRDAQGRMRKMPGLMQELSAKMKNMGEADQMQYLTNIFGQEAASGMLAVMRASVDGTLKEYEMLGHESTGVISKMAELSGVKMEEMRANLQSLEPALATLGLSFQEASIMMAMVAKSGIKNSDATLALTETYRRLTKEPKQVQKALKGMNISLYDSDKKMKNLPALMDELQKAMSGMSEADQIKSLTEIFGVAAAPAIMKMIQGLADGTIEEYRKAAKEATGISHDMADTMQDTLKGQMTIAGSAIEGLMIEIGNVIAPYAKIAVYWFTRAISGITKFLKEHPIAKSVISWVAGLSALSVGITALKYSWLAIKLPFQSMRVAMDLMNAKTLENAGALAEAGKKAGIFSKVSGKISAGAKGIGNIFKAIGSGIGKMFSSVMNVGKGLISGLFSPLGLKIMLIGGAIALLAAGAYFIYKKWDKVKEWWNNWVIPNVWEPIKKYATAALNYVKGLWQDFMDWWNGGYLNNPFEYITTPEFEAQAKIVGTPEYHINAMNSAFAPPELPPVKQSVAQDIAVEQKIVSQNNIHDEVKKVAAESAYIQKELQKQTQNITILNRMSEGFSDRVAEMTSVWQPFKDSLGEGFEQLYNLMQGIADRIRGVTIPAVNELASALSKIATEISSIVQAGSLEVEVKTQSTGTAESYSRTAGGTWRGRKRAAGGFINHPEIALIGEAGREAVIPLENKARGLQLWQEVGRELGLMSDVNLLNSTNTKNAVSVNNVMPELVNAINLQPQINNVIPHATGGIFSTPYIGLVAEAGREAVIPLESQARGTQLWFEAGRELGLISSNKTITNTSEHNVMPELVNAINLQPQINNVIPHATGGIFSTPYIGLVAEAGRELGLILGENTTSNAYSSLNAPAVTNSNTSIKPSERNTVSILNTSSSFLSSVIEGGWNSLKTSSFISNAVNNLRDAGMGIPELGSMNVLNRIAPQNAGVMPSIMNAMNFQPIISGIGDLFPPMYTEQGESPSLEDATRNIPLWLWAEKDIGGSFSSSTTNNSNPVTISPSFNITVNGGDPGAVQEIRRIIEEVLSDIQDREARTRFD